MLHEIVNNMSEDVVDQHIPKVVYTGGTVDAGLLRAKLEDAGIEAFLHDEVIGTLLTAVGEMGGVKVVVEATKLDAAQPIVDEFIRLQNTDA